MGTLGVFVGLCVTIVWLVWELRRSILILRRIGLGGPEEDLERARNVNRRGLILATVFVAAALATLFVGARWSSQWRETPIGAWTLNIIGLVAGAGFVRAWLYGLHQQWSSKGSYRGMAKAMFHATIAVAVAALAIYWRWG